MLTKRVIPCLDVKDGRVVKGVNFVSLRDAGDPVELARAYDREGADEVVFLDITATSDNRATTIEMAAHAAEELAIPYTVGGGFRDMAGMRSMVAAGADKVSLNSAAVRDPSLISQAAAAFGSQAVVVAIDAKRVGLPGQPDADKWEVFTAGGRNATALPVPAGLKRRNSFWTRLIHVPPTSCVRRVSCSSGRRCWPIRRIAVTPVWPRFTAGSTGSRRCAICTGSTDFAETEFHPLPERSVFEEGPRL